MLRWIQRFKGRVKRLLQTRTEATDPKRIAIARAAGTAIAWRRCIGLVLLVNSMLWASLTGIAAAERTLWQAALLLIPAGLGVWGLSRKIWGSEICTPFRPWEWLLLLPCFLLDAIWVLHGLLCLQEQLMPSYPPGILRVWLPLVLTAGVLLGRRNGTAYGISLWRWFMPLIAVWVLVHGLKNQGTEQLYPLMGQGWQTTANAAAAGLGSLWAIGLVFLVPGEAPVQTAGIKPPSTWQYVLCPLSLTCLLALALCSSAAWLLTQEARLGLRLLWVGRAGGSSLLSGLWALYWLLALMAAFCILLASAARLTGRIFPRFPEAAAIILLALTAAVLLWVPALPLQELLQKLLPWRLLLWAACAAVSALRQRMVQRRGRQTAA